MLPGAVLKREATPAEENQAGYLAYSNSISSAVQAAFELADHRTTRHIYSTIMLVDPSNLTLTATEARVLRYAALAWALVHFHWGSRWEWKIVSATVSISLQGSSIMWPIADNASTGVQPR